MLYIAADHRGFKLKEELKKFLEEKEISFEDLGNLEYDQNDDYPVFAQKVAEKISQNPSKNRGILICGSGIGMSAAANRFKNVRAGLVFSENAAQAGRKDDDINIAVLPADFIDFDLAKKIITKFLKTDFSGLERYKRRIEMVDK